MTSNPQQPRLGPAWRGKGSGFQPPPAVPDAKQRPNSSDSSSGRNRSGSNASGEPVRRNPFSALEEDNSGAAANGAPPEGGRFSSLSSRGGGGGGFHRSSSSVQGKPRSLADLAASAPPPRRNTLAAHSEGRFPDRGERGGGDRGGVEGEKVIRYTREKLLSLRPRPSDGEGLPDCLKGMEGSVIVSSKPLDPGEICSCYWLRWFYL